MLGDAAFTLEFPDLHGAEGAKRTRKLCSRIQNKIDQGGLVGVVDIITATRSLSVCIDPLIADYSKVRETVLKLAKKPYDEKPDVDRLWRLPACYHGQYAPDLDYIAEKSGLSPDEIVRLHSQQIYDILLIGFVPGFPYMSEVPKPLRQPRRATPRIRVPAGSVAVVNDQTAIYPWESPGGWHLIARCPVPLFNPGWDRPSLLAAGEQVHFEPISEKEFKMIETDLASGKLDPTTFVKRNKH